MNEPERCAYVYVFLTRPGYRCNGRKRDHPDGVDERTYHEYVPPKWGEP